MTALARAADPQTSHMAADKVARFDATHKGVVLGLLDKHPESTYQELFARHVYIQMKKRKPLVIRDAPSLMRRLCDLTQPKLVNGVMVKSPGVIVTGRRECLITGREASVWIPAEDTAGKS